MLSCPHCGDSGPWVERDAFGIVLCWTCRDLHELTQLLRRRRAA